MLRVNQIKVQPEADKQMILNKAASILKIKPSDIEELNIVKQSIDARKKPEIYYSYAADVKLSSRLAAKEDKIRKNCRENQVTAVTDKKYVFPPAGELLMKHRPVIVGMGPAGLFAGYMLSLHGYCPILLERGRDVDARTEDVMHFWETGILNPSSNVQFGEGGAGTFSDGKLNTLVKDKDGRNKEVLRILVEHGAPEKILYDAKPHIGTDVLTKVVKSMRETILINGGEVHFETEMKRLLISEGHISGVQVCDAKGEMYEIPCETVILAIGHSARNTFETLYEQKVPMEAKSFAVGFRVEHPQAMINMSQYGREDAGILGAAAYKVTAQTLAGRGVYSFCMCPGGYVVNASSEEGRLAVNGMSYSDRGSANANSAIIVAVTPEDFKSDHPLAGIAFQRELEKRAYEAGKGKIPVQRYGDFRKAVEESDTVTDCTRAEFMPCTRGEFIFSDLTGILPKECNCAFVEGMEAFGHQIQGFNSPETLMLGVESRTSSPVRIHRDETLQSALRGLYPCGEGAGYAGGITSAAMDGMRIAEEIAGKYSNSFAH